MDITTLVGVIVAFGLVLISCATDGSSLLWFVNYPSLMIVGGGVVGATLLAYPLKDVLGVVNVVKNVLFAKEQLPGPIISLLVGFAQKARREGILSFESTVKDLEDPFLKKSLQLAIDGMESSAIEEILSTELKFVSDRHKMGSDIFLSMGAFAPAVGMLGTIIGLIQMLMNMSDPSAIGAPMAVALLTTFYGTMAANLLFIPIANKLRRRSNQELLIKRMVIEGVLSIQRGDNHRIVEQKLKAFLPPLLREHVAGVPSTPDSQS